MKRVSSIEYGVLGMDAGSGGGGYKLKGKPETGKVWALLYNFR